MTYGISFPHSLSSFVCGVFFFTYEGKSKAPRKGFILKKRTLNITKTKIFHKLSETVTSKNS